MSRDAVAIRDASAAARDRSGAEGRPVSSRRGRLGPLPSLLCVVTVVTFSWALLVPPWQAPDEPAHFAYVQTLVERHELPGTTLRPAWSTEQSFAAERANSDQTAGILTTKPQWSEAAYRRWRSDDARLPESVRSDGGGEVASNPPLYYAYAALPYLAFQAGDVHDRLYAMRLWSALLLVATAAATWLLVGELVGRQPLLQLAAGGVVGLWPMTSFISSSVNPDAALFLAWSVVFWLGARLLRRGLTVRAAVALAAAVAAAVLVKATSYALVPAAAFLLLVAAWRARERPRPELVLAGAAAASAVLVPVGLWYLAARELGRSFVNTVAATGAAGGFNVREFLSYAWQFYVPPLSWQVPFPGTGGDGAYQVWLKTGSAAFGWLEVRFPEGVYLTLAWILAAIVAANAVALVLRRHPVAPVLGAFFLLTTLGLLLGLHLADYRILKATGTGFIQGRYLLPLVPLLGIAAVAFLRLFPRRWREVPAGLLLAAVVAFQLFSLALVVGRFYV